MLVDEASMTDDTPGDEDGGRALEKERKRGSDVTNANNDNAAAMGSTAERVKGASSGDSESHLREQLRGGEAEGTTTPGKAPKQLGISNSRSQLAQLRPKRPKQRAVLRKQTSTVHSEDSSAANSEASL